MNKTKRGLQLAAAITTIVFSAILLIGAFVLIAELNAFAGSSLGEPYASEMELYKVVCVFSMLFSIANITISSIICCPPKNGTHKGLCITALVLNSVLTLIYIMSGSVWCIIPLTCVVLFSVELGLKNTIEQPTQNTMTIPSPAVMPVMPNTANQTAVAPAPVEAEKPAVAKPDVANESNQNHSVDQKIERIKKLNADGIISDDEMKELILQELKK